MTLCGTILLSSVLAGCARLAAQAPSAPPSPGPSAAIGSRSSPQQSPLPDRLATSESAVSIRLTLQDAVAMAERNSPLLQAAAADTQRARASALTARAYTNPTVEVYEGRQSARPIATPGVPGLLQHYAGSQTVEIPSERAARRRAADHAIAASRFAQQGTALSVIANVRNAFYTTLRRRQEISHQRENLQLVQELYRRIKVEVDVGEKGRLELTRAEAELARASFEVRSAQIEYANAIALLRVAIAAPPETNLDPQGGLEDRAVLPPIDDARARVLRSHPAIAQSQAEISAADATLEREQKLRLPQPVVFGEFENQPDLRFWRVGVNVPLSLWDRRRGQIGEARALVTRSNAVLNQRRLELLSSLERAYEQYQLADQEATQLEAGSLHAAELAVDGALAAYRFGERGILEVLDAQRVLQSVRGDLLDVQFARQSALVDLEELGAITPFRPQATPSSTTTPGVLP